MTVLVGVLCEDGVVLGSDSSATFAANRVTQTIEQPTKKTYVIAPDMLLAGTGQVGLGQRFSRQLETIREGNGATWSSIDPIEISKGITKVVIKDFSETQAEKGRFGALLAYSSQDRWHLCEFAIDDLQPEQKGGANNWFASMGSGQPITDPFLGFLRQVFFPGGRPTLQEGVFLVTWALEHAIRLNTGGINGPSQIGVLRNVEGVPVARLLEDEELSEHIESVRAAESHLAEYRQKLSDPAPTTTESPPAPPNPVG